MPKAKLTDGPAGNVHRKPPNGGTLELWDTVQPGLSCRIGARGGSYLVLFRMAGDRTQLRRKVGSVATTSLEEARGAARQIIKDAARGIHPDQRKREADEAAQAENLARARAESATVLSVGERYLEDNLRGGGGRLTSREELRRKLMVDLKPWHARPIGSITKAEIRDLVRAKAQTAPAAANRLLAFLSRLFGWASEQDLIDADPVRGIARPGDEESRDRALTEEEIKILWRACERLPEPVGRLYRLCLATGQRKSEVAGMRRSELGKLAVDATANKADYWLLPAERTKRDVAHAVPLSRLALELITSAPKPADDDGEEIETDHVLPSPRRGDQSLSGWSRFKLALDEQIGRILAEDLGEDFNPERHRFDQPFTIHDLRRTFASHLEAPPISVDRRVVSKLLNHAEGGTTAKYARYQFDAESHAAMEAWGLRLEQLTGENVVELGRRGA